MSLFRSGTYGLGSLRERSREPLPSCGRNRLSKAERKERIATLRPLVLAHLKRRQHTVKQLQAIVELNAYETELRIVVADLLANDLITLTVYRGRLFYKGIP